MNLTEWIVEEDLSIKEFAEEFTNVVKENFGKHNYKCVVDIVNENLSERQTPTEASKEDGYKQLNIGVVSNNEVFSEVAVCDCKAPAFRDEHGNHRCTECNELCNTD